MEMIEPLLDRNQETFVLLPVKDKDIWDFYQKALACFWTAQEIDLSQDKFDELSAGEQHFLKYILAFFAASDGIVNSNLDNNFASEIVLPEAKAFFHLQTTIEDIHSHVYSNLLLEYVKDADERHVLINAITTIPCIKKKADWTFHWIREADKEPFAKRILAFAIVEGIFFSGAFCAIFWFASRNKLPGLKLANDFIARDEGLHCDFSCLLYSKLLYSRLPESTVHAMVKGAVEIEEEFIRDSLPVSLLGMNANLMTQYIQFIADRLVKNIGYRPIYEVKNPFPFMHSISLENKINFFESRSSTYQKSDVLNKVKNSHEIFKQNTDF